MNKYASIKLIKMFQEGKISLETVLAVAKTLNLSPREATYIGRGSEGIIHLMSSGKIRKIYDTKSSLITPTRLKEKEKILNILNKDDRFVKYYGRDTNSPFSPIHYFEFAKKNTPEIKNLLDKINFGDNLQQELKNKRIFIEDLDPRNIIETKNGLKVIDFLNSNIRSKISLILKGIKRPALTYQEIKDGNFILSNRVKVQKDAFNKNKNYLR